MYTNWLLFGVSNVHAHVQSFLLIWHRLRIWHFNSPSCAFAFPGSFEALQTQRLSAQRDWHWLALCTWEQDISLYVLSSTPAGGSRSCLLVSCRQCSTSDSLGTNETKQTTKCGHRFYLGPSSARFWDSGEHSAGMGWRVTERTWGLSERLYLSISVFRSTEPLLALRETLEMKHAGGTSLCISSVPC